MALSVSFSRRPGGIVSGAIPAVAPRLHGGPREGQGLVEYALILLLVAVVAVTGLAAFGASLSDMFSRIVSSWPT